MTTEKNKIDWCEFPGLIVGLFFSIFFAAYLGEFGFTDMIVKEYNNWHKFFNIGVWMVIEMACIDLLMKSLTKFAKGEKTE